MLNSYTAGKAPQVGQLLAFGTTGGTPPHLHGDRVRRTPARPARCTWTGRWKSAVTANDPAFPGPYGSMNLAFHRDALALVTRPLALPDSPDGRHGRPSPPTTASACGCLMQYDINAGGTVVNCDILAGVAVLDSGLLRPRARLTLSSQASCGRPIRATPGSGGHSIVNSPPGGRSCLMDFLLFAQARHVCRCDLPCSSSTGRWSWSWPFFSGKAGSGRLA